jgi:hypothetical protein
MSFPVFCKLVHRRKKQQSSLINKVYQKIISHPRFDYCANKNSLLGVTMPLPAVGIYNQRFLSFANSQSSWITDNYGTISVDFIVRFENLEADLNKLAVMLELPLRNLPKLNSVAYLNYKSLYDSELVELVSEIYADDIKNFKYSF